MVPLVHAMLHSSEAIIYLCKFACVCVCTLVFGTKNCTVVAPMISCTAVVLRRRNVVCAGPFLVFSGCLSFSAALSRSLCVSRKLYLCAKVSVEPHEVAFVSSPLCV